MLSYFLKVKMKTGISTLIDLFYKGGYTFKILKVLIRK